MIEIHGKKIGLCTLCVGKAKKQKEVLIVKGDFKGELCKEHVVAITQQEEQK